MWEPLGSIVSRPAQGFRWLRYSSPPFFDAMDEMGPWPPREIVARTLTCARYPVLKRKANSPVLP
ncbi:MAG TPA: hypothetical protein VN737_17675 [Bryobacteraceae bacterium]|nr:hypothetical protein [Bryobacteraceae bacterium]